MVLLDALAKACPEDLLFILLEDITLLLEDITLLAKV
jgi:hypothetical protein